MPGAWNNKRARGALTQRCGKISDAAVRIGMDSSGLRHALGSDNPRAETADWIAQAAGVSLDYLCGRTDNPKRGTPARKFESFYTRLDFMLRARGRNLVSLAGYLNIPLWQMQQMHRTGVTPTVNRACRMAEFLDVSLDWLMGCTENRNVL